MLFYGRCLFGWIYCGMMLWKPPLLKSIWVNSTGRFRFFVRFFYMRRLHRRFFWRFLFCSKEKPAQARVTGNNILGYMYHCEMPSGAEIISPPRVLGFIALLCVRRFCLMLGVCVAMGIPSWRLRFTLLFGLRVMYGGGYRLGAFLAEAMGYWKMLKKCCFLGFWAYNT